MINVTSKQTLFSVLRSTTVVGLEQDQELRSGESEQMSFTTDMVDYNVDLHTRYLIIKMHFGKITRLAEVKLNSLPDGLESEK